MIFEITIGLIAGSIGSTIFFRKRLKENKEKEKRMLQLAKDIHEEFIAYAEGKKVNEIDIRDLPRDIQHDMMYHKSLLSKIFFLGDRKGHVPPYMLLLRNNMTGVIKHRVKEGQLIIKSKDLTDPKKRIEITADKLHMIKFPNGKKYWMYVCHENEAEPYPHKPKHHSGVFYRIVLALQLAKTGAIAKKKIPKGIILIGLLLFIAFMGGIFWVLNSLGGDGTVVTEPVNNAAQQTANVINNTINLSNGTPIPAEEFKQVIV